MMHVGDILSTVEDIKSTVGGYFEYLGGYQYRGGVSMSTAGVFSTLGRNLLLFESPTVLNIPHGKRYPHMYHDTPTALKLQRMVSPHGTHDIPHVHHDIPHGTEHPHSTQDIFHGTHTQTYARTHARARAHTHTHTLYRVILLRSTLYSPLNFQGNEAGCYIYVDNKVSRYSTPQYNLSPGIY